MSLLGVAALSAPWTLGQYLRKFSLGDLSSLQSLLRQAAQRLRPAGLPQTCVVDLDAAVYEQASKNKEGARLAYNGLVGYQPLFALLKT